MKAVFNFQPFPAMATKRLLLDRTCDDDAHDLFLLRSNDDVMKYVERPRPVDADDALLMIRHMDGLISNNEAIAWAIRMPGSSKMIGVIGYWRTKPEHFRAEVGYMVLPEFWGQGLMYEALQAVLNFGFSKMSLHSVEADINPENIASEKLLVKCGFKPEAYFRENYFWQDKFYDSKIFGLLSSEFRYNPIL
jgi:[ribosomal protein S5]-alanine N-acetyltransferase